MINEKGKKETLKLPTATLWIRHKYLKIANPFLPILPT